MLLLGASAGWDRLTRLTAENTDWAWLAVGLGGEALAYSGQFLTRREMVHVDGNAGLSLPFARHSRPQCRGIIGGSRLRATWDAP